MTVKNPKELFVMLLSDARQSTERSTKFYREISQAAQDPDIKEALESRAWISEKDSERDRSVFRTDRRTTSEAQRSSSRGVC